MKDLVVQTRTILEGIEERGPRVTGDPAGNADIYLRQFRDVIERITTNLQNINWADTEDEYDRAIRKVREHINKLETAFDELQATLQDEIESAIDDNS